MLRGRRALLLLVILASLLAACGNNDQNFLSRIAPSRPPSENAVLLFVSGSWAEAPGQIRELFAVDAEGTEVERLTTCAQLDPPCDFITFSPSPVRSRVVAVRTTAQAEPGTAALFFMDLDRSVESRVSDQRFVGGVDWSRAGSFLIYSAGDEAGNEDVYTSQPDGVDQQILLDIPTTRERNPRLSPGGASAIYESISAEGQGQIVAVRSDLSLVPLTEGGDPAQPLPGTPYFVGSDADPSYAPDGSAVVFRRLTSTGNGGYGTWDLLSTNSQDPPAPVLTGGSVYRGAPDWGAGGIVFVEIDAEANEARLVVVQPDGTGRRVLHVEDPAYGMASPRWLR